MPRGTSRPPAARAIWMRRATASAVLDDELEVRRAIASARHELDRGDHPADPHWAGFVTPSEITGHEAMARLSQGKPEVAARLFRDVLADAALPPRNRAYYQALLAASLLAVGDRAEAIARTAGTARSRGTGQVGADPAAPAAGPAGGRARQRVRRPPRRRGGAGMNLTFRRYDGEAARAARATVETVYRDAYVEAVASGDPFNGPEPFMRRFDAYAEPGRGFDLVIAFEEGEPVGQSWGWPLRPGASWWDGLDAEPEPGFTDADGSRTFALSIIVRRPWTGRGVAHALHDELLRGRNEKRATLLVEPGNDVAYRAYMAWGWRKVARLRPGWPDAPLYDVLILPLPVRAV